MLLAERRVLSCDAAFTIVGGILVTGCVFSICYLCCTCSVTSTTSAAATTQAPLRKRYQEAPIIVVQPGEEGEANIFLNILQRRFLK